MARRPTDLERDLERLGDPDGRSVEGAAAVAAGLGSRHAAVVARAARVVREQALVGFDGPLLDAFDRLFDAPDPSCIGKSTIAETLDYAEHASGAPFVRGVRHVQLEPVFGGTADVATGLRVRCGLALARLGWPGTLDVLADLLGDSELSVRAGAARAVGHLGHGSALLRLKLHMPDDPEVLGECLASLCRLDAAAGLDFGARMLTSRSAATREATAITLGETRLPAALPVLAAWLDIGAFRGDRRVALVAIGLLRIPSAVDLLLGVVRDGHAADARAAVEALVPSCFQPGVRDRVRAAIGDRPELVKLLPSG